MNDKRPRLAWILNKLREFFTKNLLLKAASLFFAVVIWSAVISIENPMRRLPIANVSIRHENYQSLASKNLALTAGEASLHTVVDVVAEVPQQSLKSVSASNISAYIDLNDINEVGEHELRIQGRVTGIQGNSSVSFSPAAVKVRVEKLSQKLVPVTVNEQGTLPDGYRLYEKAASPNNVTVRGPESVVDSIASALVDFPLDNLTSTVNASFTYKLLDIEGREVPTDALIMTDFSVIIMAPVLPKEEKPVTIPEDKIIGDLPEGYDIKSIEVYPESLQVSATQDVLDAIESIEPSFIDIDGKTESFSAMVDIQMPNDVNWIQSEQISVQVIIAEEEETKLFTDLSIEVLNYDGKDITFDENQRVRVEITAARSFVRRLLNEDIDVIVDLASYDYGEHDVPIEVRLRDQKASAVASPVTLHVNIKPLMVTSD